MKRQGRNALLWGVMAIPLAYEALRLLVGAVSWFSAAAVFSGEVSSLWFAIRCYLAVAAVVLLVACGSLLSDWRPRWLWLLVAILCASIAVGEVYVGDVGADVRWQLSAQTAIQAYAVVLAVAMLLNRRPAKLTGAST